MPASWTEDEVSAIVEDYFDMLANELQGRPYEKSAHRRELISKLGNRSHGSIEFKHQNLSAVLVEAGLPYITGYKPRRNFQNMLRDFAEVYLSNHPVMYDLVRRDVESPARTPEVTDILRTLVRPPRDKAATSTGSRVPSFKARRVDYLAREARNRSLGRSGEEFVVAYEKARLESAEKSYLADRVEQVSETQGDGTGFDVLSFEANGTDRYIEVKTTRYGDRTPFHVTPNEIRFSETKARQFFLYRVFEFREAPRMYSVRGCIRDSFALTPTAYRALLRTS